jgi:hypothetical protein
MLQMIGGDATECWLRLLQMLLRLATSRILLFGFFAATSRDLLFFFYNHHVVLLHEDINFATMSSTKSILLPLYNFFSGEIFGADKVVFLLQ